MTWKPVSRAQLDDIISRALADCSDDQRAYFKAVAFPPTKWRQSPYGDEGGGFWAIAADQDRVLWYNDIEEGFNASRLTSHGTIPVDEYWCNQDPIRWALLELQTAANPSGKWGPPESSSNGIATLLKSTLKFLLRRSD